MVPLPKSWILADIEVICDRDKTILTNYNWKLERQNPKTFGSSA
jgi:hypothetical protein